MTFHHVVLRTYSIVLHKHMFSLCAVLQFVPRHIDVRLCNFSESIEKGLTMAFAEVCRRSRDSTNFTVQVSSAVRHESMKHGKG